MPSGSLWFGLAGALLVAPILHAQCDDPIHTDDQPMACGVFGPEIPSEPSPEERKLLELQTRLVKYMAVTAKHKAAGLASYYSRSLEGTLTANGERYRAQRFTAAHLTLPLGCWIEITARATGKKIRVRVNDRGPYAYKFVLDLSWSAAHALGVDIAEDRHVDFRIIGMPGEEPLPESAVPPAATITAATSW
jgi:rare lipoprotein A (peptidoglycan hydrolase)